MPLRCSLYKAKQLGKWRRGWCFVPSNTKNAKSLISMISKHFENVCSWNPTFGIHPWCHWTCWKGDISKSFGEKHVIWVRAFKNWKLPTQLIILLGFGQKSRIARPVNYSYLPPCLSLTTVLMLWTWQPFWKSCMESELLYLWIWHDLHKSLLLC